MTTEITTEMTNRMTIQRLLKLPAVRLGVPAAAILLAAAACGSSSSSATPAAPAASGGGSAGTSALTIEAHKGGPGTLLTDSAGRSLYLFASDSGTKSTCSGPCATAWPPLTTTSGANAGTGVTSSDIATITRTDGSKQVTYNGHPLYYFVGDSGPGKTNGQGSGAFGAKWWLVTPAGNSLTSSGGGASKPATGGAYGY